MRTLSAEKKSTVLSYIPFVLSSETTSPTLVSIRFTIAWYRRRRQSSMKLNLSKNIFGTCSGEWTM